MKDGWDFFYLDHLHCVQFFRIKGTVLDVIRKLYTPIFNYLINQRISTVPLNKMKICFVFIEKCLPLLSVKILHDQFTPV